MNPYLLDLPAALSFSGGRTSGYLLRHVLDAFGGQPEELVISFQNTGLEHAKTYEFIEQVEREWDIDIVWLEFCLDGTKELFKRVDAKTACKNGEPFTDLIKNRNFLPNPVMRLCTEHLKVRTLGRYLDTIPAFEGEYVHCIGLRADEPRRVMKVRGHKGRNFVECPLYEAGVGSDEVIQWWSEQPFDLDLPLGGNIAGNCVGCFLKGRQQTAELMKTMPEYFDWWVKAEQIPLNSKPEGGTFRKDRASYKEMLHVVDSQGWLFDLQGPDDSTIPCMCTD